MSVRLFIGNLPYAANEADLRQHLSAVGDPLQIVLPMDRETGRPRGFAFVDYADREVAERAIKQFDQQPFKGRALAVSEARPREDRPAGPRPGGYSPAPRPGGFGGPRPAGGGGGGGGFAPRPTEGGAPGARGRNFGPDAPPKNKRKAPRKDSDRGPKGPIKERPVSRLYENDDDWRGEIDDDLNDLDNFATSAAPGVPAPPGAVDEKDDDTVDDTDDTVDDTDDDTDDKK